MDGDFTESKKRYRSTKKKREMLMHVEGISQIKN